MRACVRGAPPQRAHLTRLPAPRRAAPRHRVVLQLTPHTHARRLALPLPTTPQGRPCLPHTAATALGAAGAAVWFAAVRGAARGVAAATAAAVMVAVSAAMALFAIHNIAAGGNPPPKAQSG